MWTEDHSALIHSSTHNQTHRNSHHSQQANILPNLIAFFPFFHLPFPTLKLQFHIYFNRLTISAIQSVVYHSVSFQPRQKCASFPAFRVQNSPPSFFAPFSRSVRPKKDPGAIYSRESIFILLYSFSERRGVKKAVLPKICVPSLTSSRQNKTSLHLSQ